jgi:hypothetical protein
MRELMLFAAFQLMRPSELYALKEMLEIFGHGDVAAIEEVDESFSRKKRYASSPFVNDHGVSSMMARYTRSSRPAARADDCASQRTRQGKTSFLSLPEQTYA